MNTTTHSPRFLKQRRFMTVLPAVILPFVTILFVLLGGGKGSYANGTPAAAGLNHKLPEANLEKRTLADKLGYYERAAADSTNLASRMKYDAFSDSTSIPSIVYNDPKEQKIYEKLSQLNQIIDQAEVQDKNDQSGLKKIVESEQTALKDSEEITRLKQMMQQMEQGNTADPELLQLQMLLEKIQEIQHPELVANNQATNTNKALTCIYNTIPAVIARNQKITQGTVVELRLLDSATINGQLIPKGHQIYGIASLSNQRLKLDIKNIGLGKSIIPADLTVFDQRDSMEGIYLPETVTADAVRGGTDNALQGLQILTMDQNVGTQLAGAGITAAKGLFSKKVRMLKGKISAGYPVLIRNNQN